MHLFAAMDLTRLFANHARMFPSAPTPQMKSYAHKATKTPAEKLIAFLSDPSSPSCVPSTDVARIMGVESHRLRRTFKTASVSAVAFAFGWDYCKASSLGICNDRRSYLVRTLETADAA